MPASDVHGRIAAPGVGYVRIAAIGPNTAEPGEDADRGPQAKSGAAKLIVDVRRTSTGEADQGLALARLFVAAGHAGDPRSAAAAPRETIAAAAGDGAITLPVLLLVDTGTSGAAEALRVGAVRQPARRSHRRAHDRPRRDPAADQAARRQRPVALDRRAISRRPARRCTRRGSSRRSPSTNRTSSSARRRRPAIRSSTKRSSGCRRRKPRTAQIQASVI